MYTGTFAPWEHYPKHLDFNEIMNPLTVLQIFFGSGWPDAQRRELKAWRHYVVNVKIYKHHHGPGNLLFIHDQNVRLTEAAYLLLLLNKDRWPRLEEADAEQIEQEKKDWVYFPDNLTARELANPYRAIQKCFKKISPQQYRRHLKEWLDAALDHHAADEYIKAADIIDVYDNLRRLYSAAWLIYQRETDSAFTRKSPEPARDIKKPGLIVDQEPLSPLKDTVPALKRKHQKALDKIKDLIVKRMPGVKTIYLAGKSEKPSIYFLLVLVADDQKTAEHEIANKIEDHCRFLGTVFAFVKKVSAVNEALMNGDRFCHNLLSRSLIVYSAPEMALVKAQPLDDERWVREAERDWERWGAQGKAFMKGATSYLEDQNYSLALFSLHQAAESSLLGIIHAILGYRPTVHNLPRMIKLTLLFTDEIKASLQLNTTEGVRLFSLLQRGYSEARYQQEFSPDAPSVRLLKDTVQTLMSRIEQVYQQFIQSKVTP